VAADSRATVDRRPARLAKVLMSGVDRSCSMSLRCTSGSTCSPRMAVLSPVVGSLVIQPAAA
jgi:hypothetical protein